MGEGLVRPVIDSRVGRTEVDGNVGPREMIAGPAKRETDAPADRIRLIDPLRHFHSDNSNSSVQ